MSVIFNKSLALPTIFHVKEGVFRQYKGPRSKEEFLSYVEEKKWEVVEPISSWQSPSSIQMSLISQFYKISMSIRVSAQCFQSHVKNRYTLPCTLMLRYFYRI